jgi:aspartate/methionine/tyrosine aminotransferase
VKIHPKEHPLKIESKLPEVGVTIFTVMSKMANDYGAISRESDVAFSKRITIDHGVATIPVSVFHHDRIDRNVVRFCFAKKDDTLAEAAEKLCRI